MAPRGKKNPVAAFFSRLVDFKVEDIFTRRRAPPPQRTIYFNEDLPPDAYEKGKIKKSWVYITNQVVTSKYTVLTFVPRNLFEQFRRVANVFFAFIAILQFLPEFSTISPGLVLLPLIVVLLITAIKDGYEDIKRHNSDRAVNHSKAFTLHGGGWVNPNVMGKKAKTFSVGVPLRKGKKVLHEGVDPEKLGTVADSSPPAIDTSGRASDQPDDPSYLHHRHHDENEQAHWKQKLWEDVCVGDFVLLRADDPIPADVLIMSTSEEENVAFVETKNLDGETNLKSRNGVQELAHLKTPPDLLNAAFSVQVEAPHANMFQFNGAVIMKDGETKFPISLQTVLLRGTVLRNTRWVVGIVLYTGQDTKIVMNSGLTPSKRSKVERQMNPQVFINLLLLAVMATVCAIVDSILETNWFEDDAPWEYGADRSDDNPRINGVITFANALITFQNVVPISLYVSIEFVRTCQAAFIYFDGDIWYEKTNTATLARSWNLSDDLGQIEYIFSDKTGTLTQNAMVFRQCSVGGKIYKGDDAPEPEPEAEPLPKHDEDTTTMDSSAGPSPEQRVTEVPKSPGSAASSTASPLPAPKLSPHIAFVDSSLQTDLMGSDPNHTRTLNGFFATLALCHTVLASQDSETGMITYKAQSPDESALVQAAADVGFIFRGREREIMRIQTPFSDHLEEYELLNLLDFTSARKRMSVIVRKLEPNDRRIFLLSKGADNVIFERLKPGQGTEELRVKTGQDLDYFASEGLRTLCLAYKVIPDEEYAEWADRYHDATVALEDRDDKIEAASDEIERNLRLLGATAIEDKLQDGVPDTIADLKRAGIKVWVATGDKLETAIAIGHSTNLIARESNLIVVRGGEFGASRSAYAQMMGAVEQFFPDSGVLDNEDIYPPEGDDRHSVSRSGSSLRRMATGNSSLVGDENGNRPGGYILVIDGSALQHALEEDFSKQLLLQLSTRCEAVICCRVSPKQKAQIVHLIKDGLGVMTLAIGDGANDVSMIQAADVGVGISGEEGLQAVNSSDYAIAQFRYLKRLLLVHGHWSYARNGNMIVNFFYKNIVCIGVLWWFQIYCGWSTTYVFEYTYLLFWNVFWSLAPVIAMGIFDRNIDDDILMKVPELYRYGREGRYFGLKLFSFYMLDGIYQSAVIFFFTFYAYYTTTARKDGYDVWMFEFSATMVIISVMAVNAYNGLNTSAWTGWVWFAVLIGVILVWAYTAIYSLIAPGWFHTDAYGNYEFLFTSAYFWLCIPMAFSLSMLPKFLAKAYKFIYLPDDIDILRWVRKTDPHHDLDNDPLVGGRLKPTTFWSQLSPVSTNLSDEHHDDGPPRRSLQGGRPSFDARGSHTDMSTGRPLASRGFSFSIEEGGVAMRRVQSRLSERHQSRVSLHTPIPEEPVPKRRRGSISLFPSLVKSMRMKKAPSPTPGDTPPSPPR